MDSEDKYALPDKWYALDYKGAFISNGKSLDGVKSEDAKYYVQQKYSHSMHDGMFPYFKYIIYNSQFEESCLKYRDIKCNRIYDAFNGRTVTKFQITDQFGEVDYKTFGYQLRCFDEALVFMEELHEVGGWKVYNLQEEVEACTESYKSLKEKYKKLETENKALKQQIKSIEEVKVKVAELNRLLLGKELEEKV